MLKLYYSGHVWYLICYKYTLMHFFRKDIQLENKNCNFKQFVVIYLIANLGFIKVFSEHIYIITLD